MAGEAHASAALLCWWLAAALSAACYFHGDLMLQARTSLSSLVRALHVTTSMAMAALAGAIACRLEMNAASDGAKLYIMTLGVYAGRRDGKIGSRLLTHALNVASRDAFVKEAYLHVQTNNFQAFEFYERFGFEKGEVVKNYYKRIEPPDAVILRRDLGASWTERELEGVTFDEDAA